VITRADVAWSLGLSAIPLAVLVWLAGFPSPWAAWRAATCMPDHCFCERLRDSLVRQPVNTATSIAFLTVAAVVWRVAFRPDRALRVRGVRLVASPMLAALFAGALLVIGLGSAFYHASFTFVGQTVDVLGMYLLGTFVILYAVVRTHEVTTRRSAVAYVLGNAALLTLLVLVPELRRWAFAAVVLVAIATEWRARSSGRARGDLRYFAAAVGVLGLGFVFWIIDLLRITCAPMSIVQGHGAWHVLGAAAAALVFGYYVSEGREEGTA